jgi:hypothetical protein
MYSLAVTILFDILIKFRDLGGIGKMKLKESYLDI